MLNHAVLSDWQGKGSFYSCTNTVLSSKNPISIYIYIKLTKKWKGTKMKKGFFLDSKGINIIVYKDPRVSCCPAVTKGRRFQAHISRKPETKELSMLVRKPLISMQL